MKNTFLNRVAAERRVLSMVNARMSRSHQLTGLSSPAISRWRGCVGIERTASINSVLQIVAEQCQRLSDRSHETFSPMEQIESENVERHLSALEKEIEKFL